MSETPRLLFVHAHPDDESLSNGATIAHYTSRGAQVQVVTCTLGEEGDVIGDRWAELTVDHADQLGGYRIFELTEALRALGVSAPIYLGGAGRWRDSGMRGTAPRRRQRFIDADENEVIGALVAIIRELCPHVVVTYDPRGGYGHPDHVHTHLVTAAAVASSGVTTGLEVGADEYPGKPWRVPKFYWSVFALSAFEIEVNALQGSDLRPEWTIPPREEFDFGYADEDIDAVIEATSDVFAAKTAALAAHATQVVVGPTGRACALSNKMVMPIFAQEHYVLAAGSAGNRDERGWETDLLAGLGLDGSDAR
ncbi:N-acetyl-1-D-myo-inositol-2-amino-2-deoxy-alpha-D-glucopyranoside deacetylase [Mycobacterium lepromatosis]|uniref:1D-myo-inositol 2-acetamido-2-deoxy-alpha-D-glucopyranoside deacetylase n=1 Tax=Mycobacterium lepromatosis TaxID=480418 RepID=A0A0F4EQ80_9MYCO|nr:N-acetyl-1-D-myo-inositol-2-amino-2-deoxy-alpha-D-glucopyranoside deacetylase [Mycobacterium lepromatosis]KJX75091.1 n-Acetyl-1-D-myo-Inosityl-2-Amino-2-Deoxy-alpha-D-GlucopyranosideDeacetylase MshB [Mycobacterium lepromatosis]UKN42595.1 1D-myo-inositol 2-acetamido-2-deoxy-alpha-D-glucopyranoside deacetylase [Mycobacterium lepromatosis]